ncbi:hypothetical protein [Flammeovirga sp. OC4]|uniref:hypothetical protein n=1 Tax=Flammeovirga sp. OC4 TaxID=1382345 RepID=UPI0012E0BCF8|nr:hypothetical protein [Flammeovirga sp. OC4]
MQRKKSNKPYKSYKPIGMARGDIPTIAKIKKCSHVLVRKVLNGERRDVRGIKEELDRIIQFRIDREEANVGFC